MKYKRERWAGVRCVKFSCVHNDRGCRQSCGGRPGSLWPPICMAYEPQYRVRGEGAKAEGGNLKEEGKRRKEDACDEGDLVNLLASGEMLLRAKSMERLAALVMHMAILELCIAKRRKKKAA